MKTLRVLAVFVVLAVAALPSYSLVLCGFCNTSTNRCVRQSGLGIACDTSTCNELPAEGCALDPKDDPDQFDMDYTVASVELVHN